MKIIGCDFHPSYEQIAMLDTDTGELTEHRLLHAGGEGQRFYEALRGQQVRVGMEAEGHSQWFEQLLQRLGHELWIGDASKIRAMAVRKQKTDPRDARHLLQLLMENRFPRLWVPSWEERDLRQLIVHRVKLVRWRTQVKNQLPALALNQKLWSQTGREELRALPLAPWASRRREDLLRWLLVEAAQSAVRHEPGMQRRYRRLAARKHRALAKVAAARQLAVRLYWMLREHKTYAQLFGGTHAGQPESFCGRGKRPAA